MRSYGNLLNSSTLDNLPEELKQPGLSRRKSTTTNKTFSEIGVKRTKLSPPSDRRKNGSINRYLPESRLEFDSPNHFEKKSDIFKWTTDSLEDSNDDADSDFDEPVWLTRESLNVNQRDNLSPQKNNNNASTNIELKRLETAFQNNLNCDENNRIDSKDHDFPLSSITTSVNELQSINNRLINNHSTDVSDISIEVPNFHYTRTANKSVDLYGKTKNTAAGALRKRKYFLAAPGQESFEDEATRRCSIHMQMHGTGLVCSKARALAARKHVIVTWQVMATVIDRLLFWIFFVGTVLAYLIILVFMPMTKTTLGVQ